MGRRTCSCASAGNVCAWLSDHHGRASTATCTGRRSSRVRDLSTLVAATVIGTPASRACSSRRLTRSSASSVQFAPWYQRRSSSCLDGLVHAAIAEGVMVTIQAGRCGGDRITSEHRAAAAGRITAYVRGG